MTLAVYGPGRVGTALATALAAADVPLAGIGGRDRAAASALAGRLGVDALADTELATAELVVLTVSDDALPTLARRLADEGVRPTAPGAAIVHCSGALGPDVLTPLAEGGFAVGAWHPFQAFATPATGLRPGILWGITAEDPLAGRLADLSRRLQGHPQVLAATDRATYHAAAVLASNYGVTLIAHAVDLLTSCGMEASEALDAVLALVRSTLDGLESAGLPGGLTGPAVRGDLGTLRLHLDALEPRPGTAALYRAAGLATLGLLASRGLDPGVIEATARLLDRDPVVENPGDHVP